nr:putative reverse transcriptase domain-containing protein [Tanacetum cinerariifolium]
KNKAYVWGDNPEEAFCILKEKLCNAPVLALFDGPNDFVVYYDASNQGFGCVLMQRDPTTAMNMALVLIAKAFKLSYSTATNNNQRISSNPQNKQIAQPGRNLAVDSCETAQEIWLRVQQMMKGYDIGIQEKKAKLFNEWERFTSNDGESIESYYNRFLKLMNDLKRNKHFPEKIDNELKAERLAKTQDPLALMASSDNHYTFPVPHQDQQSFNQNYLQQPIPNPEDITDPTTAMNMALALMAKAFKLNYSTPTNNNQRISSNPRNKQTAQPGMNMGQDRQMQMVGECWESGCSECNSKSEEAGIQLQAEEFDLMVAAVDLDEIEEVNENCILMANLQQASTSGTQTDKAPIYDSDGSAEMIGGNGGHQFRQYAGQNAGNLNGYNEVQNVRNQIAQNLRVQNIGNQNGLIGVQGNGIQNQIGNGNLVAARAERNAAGQNANQIRCYNCRGFGHYARNCTARPRRRDAVYLQTQLLIAQKEEA